MMKETDRVPSTSSTDLQGLHEKDSRHRKRGADSDSLVSPSFLHSLYTVAPFIFFSSLTVGIAFYMYTNHWDFPTAYFFASSVLIGAMYLVPSEANPYSQVFTLFYFLWGTTLLMGAIAALANEMLANAGKVAADERRRILSFSEPVDNDGDGIVGISDRLVYYRTHLLHSIGWTHHRAKYIVISIALSWFCLGVLYGVYFEGWPVSRSMFFTLASMSGSGSQPPPCTDGDLYTCKLDPTRSLLLGSYVLLGVPIFTYSMAQFAELLVEDTIRLRERALMVRPLSDQEFSFALELQRGLRGGVD
ncbi:two pore domain potassium channel family protein, partial [archaeon]